jgi:hypothetical protein
MKKMKNTPNPHSFLDCKNLSIVVTHKAILGETACVHYCARLPSSLPGGSIVLEGFVGNLLRSEPGLRPRRIISLLLQIILLGGHDLLKISTPFHIWICPNHKQPITTLISSSTLICIVQSHM